VDDFVWNVLSDRSICPVVLNTKLFACQKPSDWWHILPTYLISQPVLLRYTPVPFRKTLVKSSHFRLGHQK